MQKNLLECRAQLWIPQSGSETAALMEEYGRHFKMKNGNRAQCHLINVKPWWREGTTACGGGAVPGHMSPEEGGAFKWANFHSVTHLSRRDDDGACPQWGCCKGGCLFLGGA